MKRGIVAVVAGILIAVTIVFLLGRDHAGNDQPREVPGKDGIAARVDALPLVYASDFKAGADAGWSSRPLEQAPNGQWFLGQFSDEGVSLTVRELPAHQLLRVRFDLYIINTWDGSGPDTGGHVEAGPDFFWVRLGQQGRTLLYTTFSAIPEGYGFRDSAMWQTYPSPLPSNANRVGTGASAIHELGYFYVFPGHPTEFPMDAIYKVELVFPHDANDLRLEFLGDNLQGVDDEGWGLANVEVEALPDFTSLEPQEMQALWNVFLGTDPVAARSAFWKLVSAGDLTVRFVEQQIPGFGLDVEQVRLLCRNVSEGVDAELSRRTLGSFGPSVEPLLESAVREQRLSHEDRILVMRMIELTPITDLPARRVAAAARLLHVINTDSARQAVERLMDRPAAGTGPSS